MKLVLPERIETERLVLRQPRQDDALGLFDAYTQDAHVARYMVWRPHTALAEAEAFVDQCLRGWRSGTCMPYVLARREAEEKPIGMLEARLIAHAVDLGYALARQHQGSGLMPEALRAVTGLALAVPRLYRVQATCDVDNHASARALEKAGLQREGRLGRYTVHPNLGPEPRACWLYALCK